MTEQDRLDPEIVLRGLRPKNPICRIQVVEKVDSTQTALADGVSKGRFQTGDCLAAEEQTAGKGRMGRHWRSQPGQSLTFSFITPNYFPRNPGWITVGTALALASSLEEAIGLTYQIKWPNDLYHEDKKLGGVLAHPIGKAELPLMVIGVGLNVNASPTIDLENAKAPPISLKELTGKDLDRSRLLAQLLNGIGRTMEKFEQEETDFVVNALRKRSLLLGCRAEFEWKNARYEGRIVDHTEELGIMLETGRGTIVLPGETAHLVRFTPHSE